MFAFVVASLQALTSSVSVRECIVFARFDVSQELAHYALATTDIEYKFPFGWDELWGIANRGSYDLDCHAAASGVKLQYTDPMTKQVCCT